MRLWTLRCALGCALSLIPTVLAPPAMGQEVPCVEVPGVNDACPAWATDYDSPEAGCTEEVAHQVVGPTAIYLAATRICSGFDILIVAFNHDGTQRWVKTYAGPKGGRDHPFGMVLSPDGRHLYLVGSEDTANGYDWVVVSYDAATGAQEWVSNHDGPAHDDDEAWVADISEDGERLYVAGFDRWEDEEGETRADTVTIAYEASSGRELWLRRFDGKAEYIDFPRAIGVSGDRVVVTGSSLDFFRQDLQTVAYRDDRERDRADELWRASYDGGDWDQALAPCLTRRISFCLGLMGSVAVTDDTAAIAATSFIEPTTDDAVWTTIAYELETGSRRWLNRLGDPTFQNKANAIAPSSDGRTIFVTGFTNDELAFDGIGDATAVAYDTYTGVSRWQSSYALPAVDDAAGFGLAVSAETVYVSGSIQFWPGDHSRTDVLTLAFDAMDGAREWVARYNRADSTPVGVGDHDQGNWAGLSTDGQRLFVGGGWARNVRIEDQSDHWDLGLLAYDV